MQREDVLAAVESAYAARPEAAVHWSPPHPDREPLEEEYSRLSDPSRYRIVGARLRAWEAALDELGLLAAQDEVPAPEWQDLRAVDGPVRRWIPVREGACPLLVGFLSLEGARDAECAAVIGAEGCDETFDLMPDCACDACDSGSEDLLGAVDSLILEVLEGFTWASGRRGRHRWSARQTSEGGSADGKPTLPWDARTLLARLRDGRAPHGAHVLVGEPWWD